MSEERIDIKVTDDGADTAAANLRKIADEAKRGQDYVSRLQKQLSAINANPLAKLASASATLTNALAREATAAAKVAQAQGQVAIATAKAATEQQRLATETARTAAAQARADTAATGAARAALSLASATERAAQSKGNLFNRANALKSALDPLYAAQMRFNAEINEANALLAAGAIQMNTYQAAVGAADARLKAANATMGGTVGTMQKARFQTANVAAQMNDLGVQFAMAAQSGEPLKMVMMALIQQGSQLSYIASTMEGGFVGLAKSMGGMLLKLAPVLVAIGALVLAFKATADAANDSAGIDKYVKTLGLTEKELKKLEDQHVTLTDVIKSTWKEMSENVLAATGLTTEQIKTFWSDAADKILYFMKAAFIGIAGITRMILTTAGALAMNVFKITANAIRGVINIIVMGMEKVLNAAIKGLNMLAKGANWVTEKMGLGAMFGEIQLINTGVKGVTDGFMELSKVDPLGELNTGLHNALGTLNRIRDGAGEIAKERLAEDAKGLIEDRSGGAKRTPKGREDKTAENRARALMLVNAELDKELARMKLLKDERAVQERMDQITQSLLQKKIELNEKERKSIEDKVRAVEDYKLVQSETDRILEETEGPQKTYNAALQAAAELAIKGKLTQAQYNAEVEKAKRVFTEATDPLQQFRDQIDAGERALGRYGIEVERNNFLEGIRQALVAKGLQGDALRTALMSAETQELIKRNDALRQGQFVQAQVANIVNPMLADQQLLASKADFYAEIDRLRQEDVLNDRQAQQAKHQFENELLARRLEGASTFFGELAGLQSSSSKELAAIGKAAAIADATIKGYQAVQNALATVPYPWNIAAAAAIAVKTGANVAAIMSTNVGSFAKGGQFMVQGKSGVDANNINMNVTKGERVTIETPAQQRANDNGRTGATIINRNKVVNLFDEKSFIAAMDSEDGEEVVLNIIHRRRNDVKGTIG